MNHQEKKLGFFTLLIALYFSQGLPSGLLAHALPTIMRGYDVDLRLIAALDLLALPWFLKFLWAPAIDLKWQRKYWIICFQSLIIPALLLLSLFEEKALFITYLPLLLGTLFVINLLSASQDIATDGLVSSTLDEKQLGFANSIQVGAYKIGLIVGGSALLIFLDKYGWQPSLQSFALAITLCLIFVIFSSLKTHKTPEKKADSHPFLSVFKSFVQQDDIKHWLIIIITFKIADSMGSGMLKPMLVDLGFTKTDIGYLSSFASGFGLLGAAVAGLLFYRLNSKYLLIVSGFFQALTILSFALIPLVHNSITWVYIICFSEQFFDGLSTVVIFACMMKYNRKGFEGSDYTVQNSLHIIGMGIASISSGFIAHSFGYQTLFILAFITGLISIAFIVKAKTPHNLLN